LNVLATKQRLYRSLLPILHIPIDTVIRSSHVADNEIFCSANARSDMLLSARCVSNSNPGNNRQLPQILWGVIERSG